MKSITVPVYLEKGDTIGLVCPAGFMETEKTGTCISVLQQWGYRVKLGETVGRQHHYFAGTDGERRKDFQQMLDDDEVKAILCARGGYGVSRIIDDINWKPFKKQPKWIIGFSDVTVFHSYLFTKLKTASMHAPMANAFNDDGWRNPYVQSLKKALSGKPVNYQVNSNPLNLNGTATGQLIGGNLSLLAHQIGTKSDIDTKNKILFIEDVGEYKYNIDRMLVQLGRAGKLKELAGLLVGGFTDMKDTVTPFGKPINELILDHVYKYEYPVCFDFPVGHQKENFCLKSGMPYELKVGRKVSLKEIG